MAKQTFHRYKGKLAMVLDFGEEGVIARNRDDLRRLVLALWQEDFLDGGASGAPVIIARAVGAATEEEFREQLRGVTFYEIQHEDGTVDYAKVPEYTTYDEFLAEQDTGRTEQ